MEVPEFLAGEEALSGFIDDFENGTWPVARFNHAAHVAVAVCYLLQSPATALYRIRKNIRRYNEAQGGKNTEDSGYHETLTRFWLAMIHAHLRRDTTRLDAARAAVTHFGPSPGLFRDYYTFDVVKSKEARASWFAPDRPECQASFSEPAWEMPQTSE